MSKNRPAIKLLIITLFSIFLIGCSNDQNDDLEVNISNQSGSTIDMIKIYTLSGSSPIDSLSINVIEKASTNHTIWKDINMGSADGTFSIATYSSGRVLQKNFGYFTNGILLYNNMSIEIYADSLVVSTTLREL